MGIHTCCLLLSLSPSFFCLSPGKLAEILAYCHSYQESLLLSLSFLCLSLSPGTFAEILAYSWTFILGVSHSLSPLSLSFLSLSPLFLSLSLSYLLFHSLTRSFIHSLTYFFIHSLNYSFIYSLTVIHSLFHSLILTYYDTTSSLSFSFSVCMNFVISLLTHNYSFTKSLSIQKITYSSHYSLSRSHTNKQVLTHTCRHNCIHFRGFVSLTLPLSLYILCITLSLSKQKILRTCDIIAFIEEVLSFVLSPFPSLTPPLSLHLLCIQLSLSLSRKLAEILT